MAREFTDEQGRVWRLWLDVNQLRKVRERTGFDGADLLNPETMRRLDDPVLLVDVLFVLVESQIASKRLTEEQFAEALVGDAIERAFVALIGAVQDFLPSSQRSILAALWEKGQATQKLAREMIREAIVSLPVPNFGSLSQSLKDDQGSTPGRERLPKSAKRPKPKRSK